MSAKKVAKLTFEIFVTDEGDDDELGFYDWDGDSRDTTVVVDYLAAAIDEAAGTFDQREGVSWELHSSMWEPLERMEDA